MSSVVVQITSDSISEEGTTAEDIVAIIDRNKDSLPLPVSTVSSGSYIHIWVSSIVQYQMPGLYIIWTDFKCHKTIVFARYCAWISGGIFTCKIFTCKIFAELNFGLAFTANFLGQVKFIFYKLINFRVFYFGTHANFFYDENFPICNVLYELIFYTMESINSMLCNLTLQWRRRMKAVMRVWWFGLSLASSWEWLFCSPVWWFLRLWWSSSRWKGPVKSWTHPLSSSGEVCKIKNIA